jgi:hypothetical protein
VVFTWRIIETVNAADLTHVHIEVSDEGGALFTRTVARVPLCSDNETVRTAAAAAAAQAVTKEQARRDAEAALVGLTGEVTV